jgi:nucleoredoxin
MDLESVTVADGEKVGSFRMKNRRAVSLKASELSSEDAKRLAEWVDPNTPQESAAASVFDEVLDGELVRLDGKKLKKCDDATHPAKYYVFYYTASWCPPCRAFTPSLVKWYNDNKNENVEIVLITSDRNEAAMEGYAAEKKMPWPQLKLSKAKEFKDKFNHEVRGIPSVMVCDIDGKLLGNYRSNLDGLTELVKED